MHFGFRKSGVSPSCGRGPHPGWPGPGGCATSGEEGEPRRGVCTQLHSVAPVVRSSLAVVLFRRRDGSVPTCCSLRVVNQERAEARREARAPRSSALRGSGLTAEEVVAQPVPRAPRGQRASGMSTPIKPWLRACLPEAPGSSASGHGPQEQEVEEKISCFVNTVLGPEESGPKAKRLCRAQGL